MQAIKLFCILLVLTFIGNSLKISGAGSISAALSVVLNTDISATIKSKLQAVAEAELGASGSASA